MPYECIIEMTEELFAVKVALSSLPVFVRYLGCYYTETEESIIQRLLKSPFIHVDETPINTRGGGNQYVWVFTDGKYVVFRFRETREATIVHEFLAGYDGVLISDFYPGYDSVRCRQQKCWPHLIRDLNDDLWAAPFDSEFGIFVSEVRDLIIPIMEIVQKYGLKVQYLGKFETQVDIFYERMIVDKHYKSELALKYQKRFIRYRKSLFTFLEQNGIPWHNNTAEGALRHLVVQEKISGFFYESLVPDYLLLLGIRQTCRFQGKSFLRFLFSEEKDIDKFDDLDISMV